MLTLQEIKTFIDNDIASTKKQLAKIGQRYYEADHDIKNYRIFYINADGQLKEDRTKSNVKICHPFFAELVDQETQYILSGKDGFVKSDIPDLQEELNTYFNDNEDFMAEFYEVINGAVIKGFDYAYAYKNGEGRTAFQCADGLGVVEVRAKETDDGCEYIIYWYIDRIGKDNKKIKRIQVWDKDQTYFYVQEDDGKIIPDDTVELNPRPHTIYKKDGDDSIYYESYGLIPFFRLDNNKKQFSGLKTIKDIIDDYDLMNAGLTNNIQDANEVLYVVKGFEGDNLDELMMNIKNKKHIGVGEDGDVEIRTIDIPHEARKTKMDIDEKNIFRFGMGVNTESLKDTSATTSIAIKSAYSLLDLKVNKLEIRLKQFMRKLLKIVLAEINDLNGTDYSQKDVYFDFTRELITNQQENAQIELLEAQKQQTQITTLLNLAAHIGNEVLMEQICDVLDLNYEDYKDRFPQTEEDGLYQAETALNSIPTEPETVEMV